MTRLRLLTALGWLAGGLSVGVLSSRAAEDNRWPFWVGQTKQDGTLESWTAAGPLGFARSWPAVGTGQAPSRLGGVRPFYVWRKDEQEQVREAYSLYPLFSYRADERGAASWSVFNLINRRVVPAGADTPGRSAGLQAFDVWPFYFSVQTGDPARDYRAVFPIAGEVKQRFGQDRMGWVLFPLYGRFQKKGVVTTTVPWPFIKVVQGEGHRGFEFWPVYGDRGRAGDYRERFFLWPLVYRNESGLSSPTPDVKIGVLPFYARDRSEGYASETWLWPFFGYVDRNAPYRYHANHYFWPFLVQGRGDDRVVNRWAPFYTHSVIKGTDKRWILWPLWKDLRYREGLVDQTKSQLLFVLYNSTVQRSVANPSAAPARKVHIWPLLSVWDNGAGRRQVQALSPFEVFLPHNDTVRWTWSPLFALYRYDHQPNGNLSHSLLWDGITYRRRPEVDEGEFNLGPLLQVARRGGEGRIAIARGLFGFKRSAGQRLWRPFFGDFKGQTGLSGDTRP
ncbi:MAG: hypothetical protein JNN01_18540 [Opitutaceae bacterium]|nr:hypothetical protein [Opitutaceae bacterium]